MKEVIQKAIEGGWNNNGFFGIEIMPGFIIPSEHPYLDPIFWKSLGKNQGWDTDDNNPTWLCPVCWSSLDEKYCHLHEEKKDGIETWRFNWHRFIDHLAEGKDADSFFKDLLTNK